MNITKQDNDFFSHFIQDIVNEITPKMFKKAAKIYIDFTKTQAESIGTVVVKILITPEGPHFRLRLKTDRQNISTVIGTACFDPEDPIGLSVGMKKIEIMLRKIKI